MWLPQDIVKNNQEESKEEPCDLIAEEVQRLNVVLNLPSLLDTDDSCVSRVQLALPSAASDFHMTASSTFKIILEKKLVHPTTFTQTFLQSILASLNSRDAAVGNAWLETLLDVIGLLPVENIKIDILPLAVQKAQLNQSTENRIVACKLLGRISQRFDPTSVKKDVLSLLLSLCQDNKSEVRASAAAQLCHVVKALGVTDVKPQVLPSLVELCNDGEVHVRITACDVIVDAMPFLSRETLVSDITPLCKKMVETALSTHDQVTVVISRVYGPMCHALQPVLSDNEKRWFVTAFGDLAQLGVKNRPRRDQMPDVVPLQDNARSFAECRYHCAYNFPAMALFATDRGSDCFPMLYPVLSNLSGDPYFLVRQTIARGFHEVVRVLGPKAAGLRAELLRLLRDDVEDVLGGLAAQLGATLLMMVGCRAFTPQHTDTELGKSLLKCEGVLSRCLDWRLHETVLEQFLCLPQVLPSEYIHTHFTALLFDCIHNARQRPVRLAACTTLLHLLRCSTKSTQRSDTLSRIMVELCQGRSCHSRMMFIKMADFSLDIFSAKFFKEHFCLPLLDLTEDSVANNRLMAVALLPRIKATFSLPSDKRLLATLEAKVRRLLNTEQDRDVISCLQSAVNKMDAIEVAQDGSRIDGVESQRVEEESGIATKCGMSFGNAANRGSSGNSALRLRQPDGRRGIVAPSGGGVHDHIKSPRSSFLGLAAPAPSPFIRAAPDPVPRPPRGGASASSFASLEEEFFVDAGIKIPPNLSLSSSLPSRIPNTALSDLGIGRHKPAAVSLKSVLESPRQTASDQHRHGYIEKLQVTLRDRPELQRRDDKASGVRRYEDNRRSLKLDDEKKASRRSEMSFTSAAENLRASLRAVDEENKRRLNEFTAKMKDGETNKDKMAAPRRCDDNRRSLNFTTTSDRVNRRHSSMDVLESRLQPPGFALKTPTELHVASSRSAIPSTSHAPSRPTPATRKISPAPLRTSSSIRTTSPALSKIRPASQIFLKTAPHSRPESPTPLKVTTNNRAGPKTTPNSRSGSPTPFRITTNSRSAGNGPSRTAPNSRPGSPTPLKMVRPVSYAPSKTAPNSRPTSPTQLRPAANSRMTSHAPSKTAPNSRPGSPTRGNSRGNFGGFRAFDVGSRLPVRKRV